LSGIAAVCGQRRDSTHQRPRERGSIVCAERIMRIGAEALMPLFEGFAEASASAACQAL
jgi:hypothetical protein